MYADTRSTQYTPQNTNYSPGSVLTTKITTKKHDIVLLFLLIVVGSVVITIAPSDHGHTSAHLVADTHVHDKAREIESNKGKKEHDDSGVTISEYKEKHEHERHDHTEEAEAAEVVSPKDAPKPLVKIAILSSPSILASAVVVSRIF